MGFASGGFQKFLIGTKLFSIAITSTLLKRKNAFDFSENGLQFFGVE